MLNNIDSDIYNNIGKCYDQINQTTKDIITLIYKLSSFTDYCISTIYDLLIFV